MLNESTIEFTINYQQPAEYHFCLESIYLAKFVASQMQSHPKLGALRVLDLCAGCGVIGIELSCHLQALRLIDFVEIQEGYTEYFHQNIAKVNRPELNCSWHLINYDELQNEIWKEQYDLIISNPPYFHPDHGMLSPSQFKNRCRFYLDSTFQNYILALANTLKNEGKAYFLLRPLSQHGVDLFSEMHKILDGRSVTLTTISNIRGTDIILLEKNQSIG